MAAAGGGNHLGPHHLAALHLIEFKFLGVAKVLKDRSPLIGDCDFHGVLILSCRACCPHLLPLIHGGCYF